MSGATDYLALALNPDAGDASVPSVVAARGDSRKRAAWSATWRATIASFLCNVAQFTANEARVLESVLKRGGGLVFFLGDQVLAERYNRELAGEQGVRVLPAQLKELVSEAQYHFDPLDYRHPLVQRVSGPRASGAVDHAGLQVLSPGAADRSRRPGWRWRSTAAIRRSSKRRSTGAARSWWPPRARCRRSIRLTQESLDHDAGLAQLRADRAGDSGAGRARADGRAQRRGRPAAGRLAGGAGQSRGR